MRTSNHAAAILFKSNAANMGYSALVGVLVIVGAAWRALGHGARAPGLTALVFCAFVMVFFAVITLPISALSAWCAERVAAGNMNFARAFVVFGVCAVATFTFVVSSLARSGPQWDAAISYAVINALLAWPTIRAMRNVLRWQ
jgi:hypothetical protein